MNFDYCRDCEREALCQYPCSEFTTESEKFNKLNDNILNEKRSNKENMEENESSKQHKSEILKVFNNDISEYLNFNVEDPEWLQAMNDPDFLKNEMLDINSIYRYMDRENERYCAENGLCEFCRSKYVEIKEPMGEQFGTPVYIDALYCPHCG